MDPVVAGLIVKTTFSLLDDIKRLVPNSDVISASFDGSGSRTEGDRRIDIEKHPTEDQTRWWFSVKPIDEYSFVRIPTTSSGIHELIGQEENALNQDSRYWRWCADPKPGTIVGGNYERGNVLVDFIVVGYKPKALLKHFSS